MIRAMMKRVEKLERALKTDMLSESTGRWHQLIGKSSEDLDAQEAALRASPEWQERDGLLKYRIVDVPEHIKRLGRAAA